jgi:hypothetical protein
MEKMAMNEHFDGRLMLEREPASASAHWEAKWFAAGSAFDPSYDRATAALRCWLDGMEAALSSRRLALSPEKK